MKISIITATFNSAATVRDTLESIVRQTYKDIEIIVVDGASTDNTIGIVKEYEKRTDGKLKFISEPDKGIYDAMNKGIAMATGEVVGLLNSDDFYTADNVLETVARELNDPQTDAVYGDVHYVDAHDLNKSVRHYSSRPFRRWMMRLGFMPAHPSFYCRKQIYSRFGGFDISFRVAADFENLLRLIFVNNIKIRYVSMDFVTMRTGGASSSGMASHRQIMKDHLRALKKNNVYSNTLLLCLRYIYKVGELAASRLSARSTKPPKA